MPTEPYWNVEFTKHGSWSIERLSGDIDAQPISIEGIKLHMGPTIILSPITTLIPMLLLLVLLGPELWKGRIF